MTLIRVTPKEGEAYFIDSKTRQRVNVEKNTKTYKQMLDEVGKDAEKETRLELGSFSGQFYSITVLDESHKQNWYGSYSVSTDTYKYNLNEVLLHNYPKETEYPYERRIVSIFIGIGIVLSILTELLIIEEPFFSWNTILWFLGGVLFGFVVAMFNSTRIVRFKVAKKERLAKGMSTNIHIIEKNKWKQFRESLK